MDPTFARQFGIAMQSDILRQAARDQQRLAQRLARPADSPCRLSPFALPARVMRGLQCSVRQSQW